MSCCLDAKPKALSSIVARHKQEYHRQSRSRTTARSIAFLFPRAHIDLSSHAPPLAVSAVMAVPKGRRARDGKPDANNAYEPGVQGRYVRMATATSAASDAQLLTRRAQEDGHHAAAGCT